VIRLLFAALAATFGCSDPRPARLPEIGRGHGHRWWVGWGNPAEGVQWVGRDEWAPPLLGRYDRPGALRYRPMVIIYTNDRAEATRLANEWSAEQGRLRREAKKP
jgi:putative NADPH-quinone reductase